MIREIILKKDVKGGYIIYLHFDKILGRYRISLSNGINEKTVHESTDKVMMKNFYKFIVRQTFEFLELCIND